jgi:DNA polymerase/3'-5' exonuclease PolX
MHNTAIARRLLDHAAALEAGGDNLYRIRAYRRAAFAVMTYPRPLADVLAAAGRRALEDVPGVGDHIAYTIEGLLRTGEFRTLGPARAAKQSRPAPVG